MRLLATITAACADDLHDWPLLNAPTEDAPDGARFDFLNEVRRPVT
jgi:hypothetical protein